MKNDRLKKIYKLLGGKLPDNLPVKELRTKLDEKIEKKSLEKLKELKARVDSEIENTSKVIEENTLTILDELFDVQNKINALIKIREDDLSLVKSELKVVEDKLKKEINNLPKIDSAYYDEKLVELGLKIANVGSRGGSANQKISVGGTWATQRYADLNLIGSGVTIAATNNDTSRTTDITFTSSGSADSLLLDQTTPQTISNGVPLMTTPVDGEGSQDQLVNKEYVDLAVSSLELTQFFHDNASDLGGIYYLMDESTDTAGSVVSAAVPTGAAVNIFNFATPAGKPGLDRLVAGVYDSHIHIQRSVSATRTVTVYYELYKRTAGGTETLLGTSEVITVTTTKTDEELHLVLTSEETLNTTDRLVVKWWATVTGAGGANPTVTLSTGGSDDSHFSVRVTATSLNTVFLNIDGTNEPGATYTYNGDGTLNTKTISGITKTFTYNGDGTLASKTDGVSTWTYTYTDGLLTTKAKS